MFLATPAALVSEISIRMSDYTRGGTPVPVSGVSSAPPTRLLSDYRPEELIYVPSPIKPQWFAHIQRRVRMSTAPDQYVKNDGEWLRQEVADAASAFFRRTADLLPGEPFIYSSRLGDLVAEFRAERGTMTAIVSPTFLLFFAVIDGEPVERRVIGSDDLREEVRNLSLRLRTGQHGALDPTNAGH
jgi:hypothetical protein